jgi:hypothetical protein
MGPGQLGDLEFMGRALAALDFDGDDEADLAIGVHTEEVGGDNAAGSVNVLYGSGTGLSTVGDQLWNQDSPNVNDIAEAQDIFGYALVSG